MITSAQRKPHQGWTLFEPIGRLLLFIAGWLLIITGLGLGVTVVLLPAGFVVGILGVLAVISAVALPGLRGQ